MTTTHIKNIAFFQGHHGLVVVDEILEYRSDGSVLFQNIIGEKYLAKLDEILLNVRVVDDVCERCKGEGLIEIIGDGENFECDVIGYKKCPSCTEE